MARPRKSTPTDQELILLNAMWGLGAATARDIRDSIPEDSRPSSQGMQQALQIMLTKGLARISDDRHPRKFEAVATRQSMLSTIVEDVRKRVFGGSLRELVQHALTGRKHSAKELEALRDLLDTPPNKRQS